MIILIKEFLKTTREVDAEEEFPIGWYLDHPDIVWREEQYGGGSGPFCEIVEFKEIEPDLVKLQELGVRGHAVFADDIEQSVFKIHLKDEGLEKEVMPLDGGPCEKFVCVYVVKEHLGFYTEPTIAQVIGAEELGDVMWRVLVDEWHIVPLSAKELIEGDKIKCFYVDPIITKVWSIVKDFLDAETFPRYRPSQHCVMCELQIQLCEAFRINQNKEERE